MSSSKGRAALQKRMKLRKSSKRPPIFGKSYCGFRDKIATKVRMFIMGDCYNINVLYDPISHEMHVVQQFNMVIGWKTYPEMTLLYHFHAQKALFKSPKSAI